jgi:hypothetical protein
MKKTLKPTQGAARAARRPKPDAVAEQSLTPRPIPLVFVSHDSRDADLAEAFDNLLTDASGGIVKSFRSSDRKGQAGIEYGAEWYPAVMARLDSATDVVALLTPSSVDRPWILYEAGVAKGKLNTTVFGVALGIPLQKASVGPFAQFQNCAADEESLTKLVLQLIRRNPEANPREEAVTRQVAAFLKTVAESLKTRPGLAKGTDAEMDATTVAKLFEEVKVMFRDLPEKLDDRLPDWRRRHRRIHPRMIEELLFRLTRERPGSNAGGWLLFSSLFREEMPWFWELAMEVYRGYCSGDAAQIRAATHRLRATVRMASHAPFVSGLDGHDDGELLSMLQHFMPRLLPESERLAEPEGKAIKKKPTPRKAGKPKR